MLYNDEVTPWKQALTFGRRNKCKVNKNSNIKLQWRRDNSFELALIFRNITSVNKAHKNGNISAASVPFML